MHFSCFLFCPLTVDHFLCLHNNNSTSIISHTTLSTFVTILFLPNDMMHVSLQITEYYKRKQTSFLNSHNFRKFYFYDSNFKYLSLSLFFFLPEHQNAFWCIQCKSLAKLGQVRKSNLDSSMTYLIFQNYFHATY